MEMEKEKELKAGERRRSQRLQHHQRSNHVWFACDPFQQNSAPVLLCTKTGDVVCCILCAMRTIGIFLQFLLPLFALEETCQQSSLQLQVDPLLCSRFIFVVLEWSWFNGDCSYDLSCRWEIPSGLLQPRYIIVDFFLV
jgi:hypothetical protein